MEVGTIAWIAPEILNSCIYDEMVDVYPYGVLLFEILSRMPPFEALCYEDVQEVVRNGGRPDTEVIPASCPSQLVVEACWDQWPKARPRFEDVVAALGAACAGPAA